MPRLIVKVNYGRTKSYNLNYVNYIATREGVEAMPIEQRTLPATDNQLDLIHELLERNPDLKVGSEYQAFVEKRTIETASELISSAVEEDDDNLEIYMNYIATRPRAERMGDHGLFSDEDHVDLEAEKKIMQSHKGNVWRFIISLTREDAERIGFDNASAWRDLMRSQRTMLAEQMKIPLSDLRWVAAFHNERHHPHIHMMVYSKNPSKGFLTEQGLEGIKSALANDLFQDDLLSVYKDMTQRRDNLTAAARMRIADLTNELKTATPEECDHMTLLKAQLTELSKQLDGITGKKVYGYLPSALKNLVDEATATLAKDERIAELYNLWYEKKYDTLRTYTDHLPEQIPLAENKEFKAIKNAIVKAAATMTLELPEDETPIEAPIAQGEDLAEFAERIVEAQSDMGNEAAPWEAPLPEPPPEETSPWEAPPSELPHEGYSPAGEYPLDTPTSSSSGQSSTWWNDQYKTARAYLYGTDTLKPDFDKAMSLMLKEAAAGNGYAMYDIGRMKLGGIGCKKDESEAHEWFRKAHEAFLKELPNQKNPSYLEYRLGMLYLHPNFEDRDVNKAIEHLSKAAEGGNAYADYALGKIYLNEDGHFNYAKATEHLARAAKAGNVDAAYTLGKAYYTGDPLNKNVDKAIEYLTQAADAGNQYAAYTLGKIYLREEGYKDYAKAIEYLTQAAESGNTYAKLLLGKAYMYGEDFPRDREMGMRLMREAAEEGNPYASDMLNRTENHAAASLLSNVARLFSAAFRDHQYAKDQTVRRQRVDKKLYRDIQAKKQGQNYAG